jgi:hypothetical protein
MKLRILLYGLLTLVVCGLATLYLVYTNQDRLLDVARYQLISLARDRWGYELAIGDSRLHLYRNAVLFKEVRLKNPEGNLSFAAGSVEMVYSLRRLLAGEVLFKRIHLERPVLDYTPAGEGGQGAFPLPLFSPDFYRNLGAVRRLDLENGTVHLRGEAGKEAYGIRGLTARLFIQEGSVGFKAWMERVAVTLPGYREVFHPGFLQGTLAADGAVLEKVSTRTDSGSFKGQGRLDPSGTLTLSGAVAVRLEPFTPTVPGLIPLGGTVEGDATLTVGPGGWGLDGGAEVRDLTVDGEPIPDCRTRVALRPGSCAFTEIATRDGNGRATGRCDLGWDDESFRVTFAAEAQEVVPGRVKAVTRHLPPVLTDPLGPASGRVAFEYRKPDRGKPSSRWTLDLTGKAEPYLGEVPARLTGTVQRESGGELELTGFNLEAGPLRAGWTGGYREDVLLLSCLASTEDLAATLLPFGSPGVGGALRFAGDLEIAGGEVSLRGGVSGQRLTYRTLTASRLSGRVSYRDGTVGVEETVLEGEGGSITLRGSLSRLRERPTVEGTVGFRSFPAEVLAGLREGVRPVAGRITGEAEVRGAWPDLEGTARLTSPALTADGASLAKVLAEFSFGAEGLSVTRGEATYRGCDLTLAAQLDRRRTLTGTVRAVTARPDLLVPLEGLGGEFRATAVLSGTVAEPQAAGSATLARPTMGGRPLPPVSLEFSAGAGRVTLEGLLADRLPFAARVGLAEPRRVEAEVSFTEYDPASLIPYLEAHLPGRVRELAPHYPLRITGRAEFDFPLDDPRAVTGRGVIQACTLTVGGEWSALQEPGSFTFSGKGFAIQRWRFAGDNHQLLLHGGIQGRSLSLDAEGRASIPWTPGLVPRLTHLALRPEVSLQIRGTLDAPEIRGRGDVRGGEISLEGLPQRITDLNARFLFLGTDLEVSSLSFRYGGATLEGDGSYRLGTREIRGRLRGTVPAELAGQAIPGVREVRGSLTLDLALAGTVAAPLFTGRASLREGALRFQGMREPLRDLALDLTLEPERVVIGRSRARFYGGEVHFDGHWDRTPAPATAPFRLTVAAEDLYLSVPDTLKMVLSADLVLERAGEDLSLSGGVTVKRGKYYRTMVTRPVITGSRIAAGTLKETLEEYPSLNRLRLDLQLNGEEGFWIDNNVAKVNTSVDLRCRGTFSQPVLEGRVAVVRGAIFYMGKKFGMEEASLRFQERIPPDPQIQARATTKVAGTTITLTVGGVLSSMLLDMYADPPLSREDIVSLLTFGQTRSALDQRGGSVSALGAAKVFSGGILGAVEEGARSITGLEIFQLEPTLGEEGSGARLIVGKQVGDRIFVSYARNLSGELDQQVMVEYQLLDFVHLVGWQDKENVYGLNLVFTWEGFPWAAR